jgi:flagellar assembly protein FliH
MSSRLIRPDDARSAGATAWRPPDRRRANFARSPEPQIQLAGALAENMQRDMDAQAQAAYQQAYAAGEAAGIQRASERIEPAAAALNRMTQELTSLRPKFRAEVEQDTVKLAIAIARRVLHRELATDPEAILGLVIAAFQKLDARETRRLRMCPADAAILHEYRARLDFPSGLEIVADASLSPGGVVFETSRGELDASVATQLAEIDRGFTDLLRRRGR